MSGWPRRRILRLTLAVIAGLLVVGCSAGGGSPGEVSLSPTPEVPTNPAPNPTSTAPTQALTEGWTEYQQPEDGFAVALPATWRKVDAGPEVHTTAFTARLEPAAALSALAAAQGRPAGSDFCFYALDLAPESTGNAFATNLNVLHRPLPAAMALADFASSNVGELEKEAQVVKPVLQERVQLPAGPAVRLQYRLAVPVAEGPDLQLSLTQLLLVSRQSGYVLTFATLPEQEAHYGDVFQRIAQSLRWLGSG